ncbi:TetR family transcriptional regulator [Gordonia sp. SID5947]|nr:TetR family transcriptional regulator [Gordonia sp. SID5947]
MTGESPRRRRDPEARRRDIIEAAATLITEIGSGGLTHRLVAKRAGVAVGSTTQYFATLDDLRQAALGHLADDIDEALAAIAQSLTDNGASPDAFAEALHDYLSTPRLLRADMALLSAAMVDPAIRPLARRWSDGLVELLTPFVGERSARAITAYIDGASVHALFYEPPMTVDELSAALTALIDYGRTP